MISNILFISAALLLQTNSKTDSIIDIDSINLAEIQADSLALDWPEVSDTVDIIVSEQVDSLSQMWLDKEASLGNDTSFMSEIQIDTTLIPDFPDSVYLKRLENLPFEVELSYNKMVQNFIHL